MLTETQQAEQEELLAEMKDHYDFVTKCVVHVEECKNKLKTAKLAEETARAEMDKTIQKLFYANNEAGPNLFNAYPTVEDNEAIPASDGEGGEEGRPPPRMVPVLSGPDVPDRAKYPPDRTGKWEWMIDIFAYAREKKPESIPGDKEARAAAYANMAELIRAHRAEPSVAAWDHWSEFTFTAQVTEKDLASVECLYMPGCGSDGADRFEMWCDKFPGKGFWQVEEKRSAVLGDVAMVEFARQAAQGHLGFKGKPAGKKKAGKKPAAKKTTKPATTKPAAKKPAAKKKGGK